ncbi:MAG: zinc-binding alcohol dehydrogenase [Pseudomonadota bacterium]
MTALQHPAHALVYTGPGQARLETIELRAPAPREVLVQTRYSALSRGTERLIFNGLVPESEWGRMRAPFQVGEFPFPVRYGYATVGQVVQGPKDLMGRDVFCLHPHQDSFLVPAASVVQLPANVPASRAVLAANMETALNAVWDAKLRPGMRILVVGAGLLGRLISDLLLRREDMSITVTDVQVDPVIRMDDECVRPIPPDQVAPGAYDLAFHTTASAAGLATALDALVFEGRVIELSWFGEQAPQVPLGGAFHAKRLTIQSSQVGHVAPSRRAHTTHRDRLAKALELLAPTRLDHLITAEVAFQELPAALPDLLAPGAPGIATRIAYR